MLDVTHVLERARQVFCILLLFISVAAGTVSADIKNGTTQYPIPVSEMEHVIQEWLERAGYSKIRHVKKQGGIVVVSAQRTTKHVQRNVRLELTPSSPLATRLHVDIDPKDTFSRGQLRVYLKNYIANMNTLPKTRNPVQPGNELSEFDADIPDAVYRRMTSVVCVKARVNSKEIQFSGFIIDPNGLILCTAHDLEQLKNISVVLNDGHEILGRVVKIDSQRDLVLLKVNETFGTFIPIKTGRHLLTLGERLFSVGCPLNLSGTILSGIINAPPKKVKSMTLWQVKMKIFPGSSGAPVFDVQGKLVGVVKGRFRGTESIGFLIPFEMIVAFMAEK